MIQLLPNQKAKLNVVEGAIYAKWPVLLEGATGCGKNVLFSYLASEQNKRIVRLNLNVNVTQEDIWGQNVLVKDGETSVIRFKHGPVVDAVQNGHWLLLDEVNAALPEVLFSLHALLEHNDNKSVYIPILQQEIDIHPEFRVLATMNPTGEYFGARNLNQAFLNRFMLIEITAPAIVDIAAIYLDKDKELVQKTSVLLTDFKRSLAKYKITPHVSARDFEKTMVYLKVEEDHLEIERFICRMFNDYVAQIPDDEMANFAIKRSTLEEEQAISLFLANKVKFMAVYQFMREVEKQVITHAA